MVAKLNKRKIQEEDHNTPFEDKSTPKRKAVPTQKIHQRRKYKFLIQEIEHHLKNKKNKKNLQTVHQPFTHLPLQTSIPKKILANKLSFQDSTKLYQNFKKNYKEEI